MTPLPGHFVLVVIGMVKAQWPSNAHCAVIMIMAKNSRDSRHERMLTNFWIFGVNDGKFVGFPIITKTDKL